MNRAWSVRIIPEIWEAVLITITLVFCASVGFKMMFRIKKKAWTLYIRF